MSNPEKPKMEFFRRILPEECISFYSEEGKAIFSEALSTGHMNCYFKLAAQFRTQDEPAYCGLSTLVMILNALDVDPGVVWKGPWRWYHENMLDCCIPLNIIKNEGINLEQFACIAECNSLLTTCIRPDQDSSDAFRQVINEYTQRDDAFIVATYSRKVLKQTGDGHFSPIAGFHPGKDLVLIMDTARFKYPPHWIKVSLLLKAMNAQDKSTGLSRGYIILKKKQNSGPLILFSISNNWSLSPHYSTPPEMLTFLKKWSSYLQEETAEDSQERIVCQAVDKLLSLTMELKAEHKLLQTQKVDTRCPSEVTSQYQCIIHKLLQQLEQTELFSIIEEQMKHQEAKMVAEPTNPVSNKYLHCSQHICNISIDNKYILCMLLLSWPFCCVGRMTPQDEDQPSLIGKVLHDNFSQQLVSAKEPLMNEVIGLNRQLSVVLRMCQKQQENKSCCKRKTSNIE